MNLAKKTFTFLLTMIIIFSLTGQDVSTAETEDNENTDDPLSLKFDFGSEDSPVADGYEKVTNTTLYSDETGFGLDKELDYRDREEQENLYLRDFIISSENYAFQVDLPNGIYRVKATAGDEIASNRTNISVNGQKLGSTNTGSGKYGDLTGYAEVTDGEMVFTMSGDDGRLNAIEITEDDSGNNPITGVHLTDNGSSVTLENSKLSLNIEKSSANISSIYAKDSENPQFNVLGDGRGYYLANYSIGDEGFEGGIGDAEFEVISETEDRIEVTMTMNDPEQLPYYLEVHMALEKDSPGFYYYTIYKYTDDMPDDLGIGQLRYAFSLEDTSYEYFVVDDERGVQKRPTQEQMENSTQLQDTTFLLPDDEDLSADPNFEDGTVYSKYQNITNQEGDNNVFMASNGEIGVSLIQASKEYFDGGPTKQELTVHDYYDGEILLWHEHTGHYGTPGIEPEKGWEKIYGPFYLYVNESTGSDKTQNVQDMWEDAKQTAKEEQDKWPYKWISDPNYAADERVDVNGQLGITDGSSPDQAWVILSPPGVDWQEDTESYVYSVRADGDGQFTVPAVRPGTYTMTAFVDGVIGEYTEENIKVDSNHSDLGTVEWTPDVYGELLWQIGTPNRSAEEFHIYGGDQGFRNHLTWLEYPYEFPNDVDFKIGESEEKEDWNYFQPMFKTPGTPDQLELRGTDEDQSLTEWKIRFDSDGYSDGVGTLSIDLAGSVFASLEVKLNGETISAIDEIPGPPGDNTSYRQAVRGIYNQLDPIQFDADLIKDGENVITLSPYESPEAPTSDDWMQPMSSIMYDVIRLEVDAPDQVDVSELESLIEEVTSTFDEEVYTEETYEALQSAIETAKESLETIDSEADLEESLAALQSAIDELEEVEEEDPNKEDPAKLDMEDLQQLIDLAKTLTNNEDIYTKDSYDALQDAIAKAEENLTEITSESERDKEIANLRAVIEGLEEKETETEDPNPDPDDDEAEADSNTDDESGPPTENGTSHGGDGDKEGDTLPKTATNMYTMLLIGLGLLVLGGASFLIMRKRSES